MKEKITLILILSMLISACSDQVNLSSEKTNLQEGTRQVHLDFHTSEAIGDIGKSFDKKQFQEALITGKINSINIFAKGHHSWCYYPTKAGIMHPGLDFDLLGAQIEACHEIGVTAQVYFTIGWSANDALQHPGWAILEEDGSNAYREMVSKLEPDDPFPWGWDLLSPEGAYLELILAQVEEIVSNYEVDGMWFDIVPLSAPNYSKSSISDMRSRGIDINDDVAVMERHVEKMHEYLSKANALVKHYRPDATIYHNWTTHAADEQALQTLKYEFYNYNTKHDLEDLPTSWGGYDIFPWRSKFFANTGKEIVAMSGKFHKSWGEFGGFKHRDAIWYEAASMVAFGASCNFGDQLHPSGKMDMATYENLGYAYDYVEQIEAFGVGGEHIARTGLYISQNKAAIEGSVQMLLEQQINFNVVNTLKDWSDIEVLIITSGGILERDIERIQDFAASGGKVLIMGKGLLLKDDPILDIGAEYLGKADYDIDYTWVGDQFAENMVASPFLNYRAGIRVKPGAGSEVLAYIAEPYFSRTLRHYSSHKNTPNKLTRADHPAVIRKGNIIFMAHDLDQQYFEEGARLHRDLFINALNLLRDHPMVRVDMPSMGRINLLRQQEKERYVLHFLYASPIQRGSVRVIEDLVPIYNIPVRIDVEEGIKKAYLVPSGEVLSFKKEAGGIALTLPELYCHNALVLEYDKKQQGH